MFVVIIKTSHFSVAQILCKIGVCENGLEIFLHFPECATSVSAYRGDIFFTSHYFVNLSESWGSLPHFEQLNKFEEKNGASSVILFF